MRWKLGIPSLRTGTVRPSIQAPNDLAKWQELNLPALTEEQHLGRVQRASRLIC
jgi:hypothetical protein